MSGNKFSALVFRTVTILLVDTNIYRLTEITSDSQNENMARLQLEQMLKKRGMSKRQFAKRLGILYPAVFRFFREGYDPKLSTLEKWAKVLDCRIRDLYAE